MSDLELTDLKPDKNLLPSQVERHLLELIKRGVLAPGGRIPSETVLAEQLGVSRPTLREALHSLARLGMIVRKQGVGTFVAANPRNRLDSGLERLESLLAIAARQGMAVTCANMRVEEKAADELVAERLQISMGSEVTEVRRVLVVNTEPVAYMYDVAPASILTAEIAKERLEGSVLDLLIREDHLKISRALAEIVAVNADPELARQLLVAPSQAVLLLEETLFDEQGNVLEYSRNWFVPDAFRFHVVRHLF